jgi:hypothetical protein
MSVRAFFWSLAAPTALSMLLAACALFPDTGSKGTMPPAGPDGQIDPATVPDFVAIAGPDTIVGYVAKAAVLNPGDTTWPVYGDDLRTVVGHLMPGRGFVPLGMDPAAIPTFPAKVSAGDPSATPGEGVVLAYVRNGGPSEAWIAVMGNGQIPLGGAGFPAAGYVGVWCDPVPLGSRLVLLDRSPVNPGALPRLTVYVAGSSTGPVSRWLDLGADGTATIGSGVPEWWSGGPPPC